MAKPSNYITFDRTPIPPSFTMPDLACDCHFHIFGPKSIYPYTPNRTYTPTDALLSEYIHMTDTIGIKRHVIVQPSVYGTDNRATLNALRTLGNKARAVIVIDDNNEVSTLKAYDTMGVRGVRMNLLFKNGLTKRQTINLTNLISPFGWHLQCLVDITKFTDLEAFVKQSSVPIVIDHMGHFDANKGIHNRGFETLCRLLDTGKVWVKLSGAYRLCELGENGLYSQTNPIAQKLIQIRPDRLVWGSDWPHPYIHPPMPNDGTLMDLLKIWAPDEQTRHAILVDNPAQLYTF